MKAINKRQLTTGYLAGIGSGLTWGLDTVLIGLAMLMTPFVENPLLLLAGTFVCSMLHDAFAAIWILIAMGVKGKLKGFWAAFASKDGLYCALGALFGGPLAMSFYMLAIAEGGPALTATVTACYPLLGSVMAIFILKEKVQLRGWIGLLICVCGIIFIGYAPQDNSNINIGMGIVLSLIAAVGWATEAVVCGYGMKDGNVDPKMALLIRECTSALVYILLVVPVAIGGISQEVEAVTAVFSDTSCWLLLLLTALFGVSSFFMWYTSIDMIGAAKALCFNVTYSFWAVVFTFILLDGNLTSSIVIGSVLIVIGVSIATLIKRKPK